MSRHNPGFEERLREFGSRLHDWRTDDQTTQEDLAATLGLSRRVYILLEQGRWAPRIREMHHMVHSLHKLAPSLAVSFANTVGTTPQDWGVALPAPAASGQALAPRVDARQARLAYDAAVYSAAEAADLPPRTLRPIVAAILSDLRDGGLTLEQAAEAAKAAAATRKR